MVRIFLYKGVRYADPNPLLSPEKVIDMLSVSMPELTIATVSSVNEEDGEFVYELSVNVGTKG